MRSILLPGVLLFFSSYLASAQKQPTSLDSASKTNPPAGAYVKFDDTRRVGWSQGFELVSIVSSKDQAPQKAYFYKSQASEAKPLIVSLHTWSGNYSQRDDLAELCKQRNLNYIHPDFRGENKTSSACCSDLALADIDDAISFVIKKATVDTSRIYVIGVSGGGYATLSTFMRSKHAIKKFSAWASITNLEAWYHESTLLKNKYAQDILACTDSQQKLNSQKARNRSPLYMNTPVKKVKYAQLSIFVGIYDGIQGSVPITQSINFYNKLLKDLAVRDKSKYVSVAEKLELLENRRPLGDFGTIADRKVCLKKEAGNVRLTVFVGDHEMLPEYALNQLLHD